MKSWYFSDEVNNNTGIAKLLIYKCHKSTSTKYRVISFAYWNNKINFALLIEK